MLKPVAPLCLLLALAACGPEPFDREGTWRATGANEANLRAMVADPAHLTRGAAPLAPARGESAAQSAALLGAASGGGGGASAAGGGAGAAGAAGSGAPSGPNRIPSLPKPQGANVRN